MAHRNFARSMRRKTQWFGFGDSAGTANLPSYVNLTTGTAGILSANVIRGAGVGSFEEEFTITRMIGQISFIHKSNALGLEGSIAIGCGVVGGAALAAGVASLPSPEDQPDYEWLFYGVYGIHNDELVNEGNANALQTGRVDFDVRGQRIVRAGASVVWIAETQTLNVDAIVGGRYLVKLP